MLGGIDTSSVVDSVVDVLVSCSLVQAITEIGAIFFVLLHKLRGDEGTR